MIHDLYRLSDSTAVEPLVNKWLAWPHLISPIPSSLHFLNYQQPILESYLANPRAHHDACRNPEMRSGPFVDIPEEQAERVRDFYQTSLKAMEPNLELATQLIQFHNLLDTEAKGQSLDAYYHRLPHALRGRVELVYDYYNHPIVRCVESLYYGSDYYRKDLQTVRIFRQTRDSFRPFFMNTPRLDEGGIDWELPFEDPDLDRLFDLERTPQALGSIMDLLGVGEDRKTELVALLSSDSPPAAGRWDGPGVRIRYFGHASVLVECGGVSIIVDPCLGVRPSEGGIDRLTYTDLPDEIDYVLVTHSHQDHFSIETLLRLRRRTKRLVVPRSLGVLYGDLSLRLMGRKVGFKEVTEVDVLDSIPINGGEITAIPFMGEHADLAHGKTAYVVRFGNQQILFAADSDCLDRDLYYHVRNTIGPIQTVFIGMECVGAPLSWSCGPFLPAKPQYEHETGRRYKGCDSERALDILEAVDADRVFIYAMGLEPWLEHLLGLAYSEDVLQIKEARRLLKKTREAGFVESTLLFGKQDIHLLAEVHARASGKRRTFAPVNEQFSFE